MGAGAGALTAGAQGVGQDIVRQFKKATGKREAQVGYPLVDDGNTKTGSAHSVLMIQSESICFFRPTTMSQKQKKIILRALLAMKHTNSKNFRGSAKVHHLLHSENVSRLIFKPKYLLFQNLRYTWMLA
jgi:hypothetical protein